MTISLEHLPNTTVDRYHKMNLLDNTIGSKVNIHVISIHSYYYCDKGKVKRSLGLIKHHNMKTYGGMEV
jgi:hypothetical protein